MSKNKRTSYVETVKRDTDADGDFDSIDTETFTYDSRGRLLSEESRSESILDGTRRYEIHTYEYDGGKQPVRKTQQQDFDGDGVSDSGATTTYRYNDRGDLRQEVTTSPDRSGDGNPDYRIIIDYTYDDKGHLTKAYTSNYYDEVLLPNEYRSEEYQYDREGNLVSHVIDDPWFYDFIVSWTYEYDRKNHLISVTHHDEFDYGPDGSMVISRYTYDREGNLETETQYGKNYNGVYNDKLVYTYDYDGDDKLVGKVLEVYREADGPLTGLIVSQYRYDGKDNLAQLVELKDLNGDRVTDTQDLYTYVYDKSGRLTGETRDYASDGVIDYENTRSPLDPGALAAESPLLA